MMFNNKVYSGDNQVLQVFATVAQESSTDPMLEEGVEVSNEYISMRYAAKAALGIAHMSDLEMVPLNGDTFRRLLRDVTLNKSPDSNGVASEHILFGSEGTLEVVMEMMNLLMGDIDYTSHPLLNLGVAVMIHKGKGKSTDRPNHFRRVQVSSIWSKLYQRRCLDQAGKLKDGKHYHEAQYGFRPGTNFLQCSILRETASRYAHFHNIKLIQISTDVSQAFNRTLRWIQIYQLSSRGESGPILRHAKASLTNTNFVIKAQDTYSNIIPENLGQPQGNLYSPFGYLTYSQPLQNMIDNARVKVDIAGVPINNNTVVDDQLNYASNNTDFLVISDLFEYFQKVYKLSFGWEKTELNIFGTKNPELETGFLKFGGVPLKISGTYIHTLGFKSIK